MSTAHSSASTCPARPYDSSKWGVMRGPLILVGVITSILWPWVVTLSPLAIIQILLTMIGALLWMADVWKWTKCNLRERIGTFLDDFVLDDFLRMMHDPETGVIPCLVGSFMGAHSMYGLKLDDEQKTRLLQASLWTGKEEARSILLDAGGTKALLPESIQEWLAGKGKTTSTTKVMGTVLQPETFLVETVVEEETDCNSSDSEEDYQNPNGAASPRPVSPECTPRRRMEQSPRTRPNEVSFQRQQLMPPPGIPTDPVMEMLKIMRDIAIDKLRPLFASIPETKVELMGTLAALGFCAQMVLRARSKRSLFGTMIGMGLSGTATGAFCTVIVRQAMLGSIRDLSSFKLVSSMILSRSLQRIKNLIANDKRMSAVVALIVLTLVGRKNPRSESAGRHKKHLFSQ